MSRKWTPRDKISNIKISRHTLSFVIIPRMFWRNLTKIGQIYIPYKFAQSGCIPPKIWCKILAHKGSQTTHATPGDYLVSSWNLKPIGQRDLWRQRRWIKISRKSNLLLTPFFISRSLSKSVEVDDTIMSKVVKGKGKPRQRWKNREPCWGARRRIDIQPSKLRFEAIVNVFVSRLVLA